MRRLICVTVLLTGASVSLAQAADDAFFVPDPGGQSLGGTIEFSSSREPAVVLDGVHSVRPEICPAGAFWIEDRLALQACDARLTYRVIDGNLPLGSALASGSIPLQLSTPGTGTDKPPPMRGLETPDDEVQP